MGEYISTKITIGGKLPRQFAETLVVLLDSYHLTDPDDREPVAGTLHSGPWFNSEVNYGQIDNVVDFCIAHDLDYEHWTDICAGEGETILRKIAGEDSRDALACDGVAVLPYRELLETESLVTGFAQLIADARYWTTPIQPLVIV